MANPPIAFLSITLDQGRASSRPLKSVFTPFEMRKIVYHFYLELSVPPAENIQGRRILPELPKSVKRNSQGLAYDGAVYEIVTAEQQEKTLGSDLIIEIATGLIKAVSHNTS
jgi:hypothetical protein